MAKSDVRSPTDIDIMVGRRIKLARKAAKLSQSELGVAVGITYQQIQKYENGTDRVAASRLVLIAEKLDVAPGSLLGDGAADAPALLDDMAIEVATEFARLKTRSYRRAAIEAVKALVAAENDHADA